MAIAIAFLFLVLASPAVYAVDHVVGGSSGWSLAGSYDSWAAGENFTVGDKLIFNYDSSHGVDEVSQSGYDGCSTSNAIKSYSGGQTSIALSKAGPMYFVCPSFGHCGQGMKLSITVQAAGGSTPGGSTPGGSPPTTPTTPSTPGGGSTSPSNGTPSTPTPASRNTPSGSNDAAGRSINHLMLGFSLVLAALIAFRG